MFLFFLQILSENFLIPTRIQRDTAINVLTYLLHGAESFLRS